MPFILGYTQSTYFYDMISIKYACATFLGYDSRTSLSYWDKRVLGHWGLMLPSTTTEITREFLHATGPFSSQDTGTYVTRSKLKDVGPELHFASLRQRLIRARRTTPQAPIIAPSILS